MRSNDTGRPRTVSRGMHIGLATLLLIGSAFGSAMSKEQPAGSFSPRLTTPRVTPVDKGQLTPEQQAMLASRPDYNIYTTLAHNVTLYDRWSPLGQFLLNGSGCRRASARS